MSARRLAQSQAPAPGLGPSLQQQEDGDSSRTLILAIVIPCGVAIIAAAIVAWLLVVRHRRAKRNPVPVQSVQPIGTVTIDIKADASIKQQPKLEVKVKGLTKSSGPHSSSSNVISSDLLSASWTVVRTSSSIKHSGSCCEDEDNIVLGVLLGAGSSARVYRGRWRGEDVAVKVLRHTATTAAAVANETAVIMSLDHPNVVMAHHVVTWTQSCTTSSSNVISSSCNVIISSSNSQAAYSQSGSCQLTSSSIGSLQSGREHSDDLGPLSQSSCGSIKRTPELPDIAEDGICVDPKADQISSKACEGSAAMRAQPVKAVQPAAGVPQEEHAAISDADVAQTWLVQELCDAGTLHDAVRAGRFLDANGKVDRVKVLCRLHDVAEGMHYVHKRNVIHRDLKASNCLLVTDPCAPYEQTAKLADFGLSCLMHQDHSYWSTLTLGTVSHMAPELLRCGRQSPAADVYAFGIVMWEVAAGTSAFDGMHYIEVISKVALKGQRPQLPVPAAEVMGQGFISLMEDCWAGLPSKRPRFRHVCQRLHAMLVEAGVYGPPADQPLAPAHAPSRQLSGAASFSSACNELPLGDPSCAAAAAGSNKAAMSL